MGGSIRHNQYMQLTVLCRAIRNGTDGGTGLPISATEDSHQKGNQPVRMGCEVFKESRITSASKEFKRIEGLTLDRANSRK